MKMALALVLLLLLSALMADMALPPAERQGCALDETVVPCQYKVANSTNVYDPTVADCYALEYNSSYHRSWLGHMDVVPSQKLPPTPAIRTDVFCQKAEYGLPVLAVGTMGAGALALMVIAGVAVAGLALFLLKKTAKPAKKNKKKK